MRGQVPHPDEARLAAQQIGLLEDTGRHALAVRAERQAVDSDVEFEGEPPEDEPERGNEDPAPNAP